jgi:ribosomal protein S27AE
LDDIAKSVGTIGIDASKMRYSPRMIKNRFCPKCSDNQQMKPLPLNVVPLTVKTGFGDINIGTSEVGIPVRAYECPNCGIIEFYHEREI